MNSGSFQPAHSSGRLRDARALIGWLPEERALELLASNPEFPTKEHCLARFQTCRAAVEQREPGIEQSGVIEPAPAELDSYIEQFWQHPSTAKYRDERWTICMAKLDMVCAAQAVVLLNANPHSQDIAKDDPVTLARITLPLKDEPDQYTTALDQGRNSFILSSRNQNFRLSELFHRPIPVKGRQAMATGFVYGIEPSFVQVASLRGRYVLRDGYHRTSTLLRSGVSIVPVLYRNYTDFEPPPFAVGTLPPLAYWGDRPATLSDFWSDEVSEKIRLPDRIKVAVVNVVETWVNL